MAYLQNFTLYEFENKIRNKLGTNISQKQYQEEAGRVARLVRDAFFEGKTASKRSEGFFDWLGSISDFLGEYDEDLFEKKRKIFHKSAIDTLCNKESDSTHFALPLHYRLHMCQDDVGRGLAEDLDKRVFGGKTFEIAVGRPVFVYEPAAIETQSRLVQQLIQSSQVGYVANPIEDIIRAKFLANETTRIIVTGLAGCRKTALMTRLSKSPHRGESVAFHFVEDKRITAQNTPQSFYRSIF